MDLNYSYSYDFMAGAAFVLFCGFCGFLGCLGFDFTSLGGVVLKYLEHLGIPPELMQLRIFNLL